MPAAPRYIFVHVHTARLLLVPVHDTNTPLSHDCECMQMPSNASNSPSYFFHSQAIGPAHVINLSPYIDYTPGSPQWQWLAEDLAGINRSVTPWVIVDIHNPWYPSTPPAPSVIEANALFVWVCLSACLSMHLYIGMRRWQLHQCHLRDGIKNPCLFVCLSVPTVRPSVRPSEA